MDSNWKGINKKIGIDKDNRNFAKFRSAAESKSKDYHYDVLLEKWNELERKSVNQRGHEIHNIFSIGLVVAYWGLLYVISTYFSKFLMLEIKL